MKVYPFTGPLNKEINVKVDRKPIARMFNQSILLDDSGTARLRKGSQTGEILEEFDIHSQKIVASGNELVLFPEKPFPYDTEIFLTIDDGFVISKVSGEKCNFLNETSDVTFSFTTEKFPEVIENENFVGKELSGGRIVTKIGGRYLIISPKETELNLFWEEKDRAILYTEKVTKTSGWFIPSLELLQNTDLNLKKELYNDKENNIFWIDNSTYSFDMDRLMPIKINKNTLNKVRTFKFVGV
jgi:hypothetical protein